MTCNSTSFEDLVEPGAMGIHAGGEHVGHHAEGVPLPWIQPQKRGCRFPFVYGNTLVTKSS